MVIVDRPEGLWNREASRQHFATLGSRLAHRRNADGRGRILVDLSATMVQTQDSFGYVEADFASILAPTDKVAFAGGSTLLRLQKKRLSLPAEVRVFATVDDARTWLEQP